MNRRSLSDLLIDLTGGLVATPVPIITRSLELTMPVDVRFGPEELSADVPLCRWRTAFDPAPSRLSVHIVAEEQ